MKELAFHLECGSHSRVLGRGATGTGLRGSLLGADGVGDKGRGRKTSQATAVSREGCQ